MNMNTHTTRPRAPTLRAAHIRSQREEERAREAARDAVTRRVFETAELMELILLDLPLPDLYKVQRVCKAFKDTIDGSVNLQRAMYILPAAMKPGDSLEDCVVNPLLETCEYMPCRNLHHFSTKMAPEWNHKVIYLPRDSNSRPAHLRTQDPPVFALDFRVYADADTRCKSPRKCPKLPATDGPSVNAPQKIRLRGRWLGGDLQI